MNKIDSHLMHFFIPPHEISLHKILITFDKRLKTEHASLISVWAGVKKDDNCTSIVVYGYARLKSYCFTI